MKEIFEFIKSEEENFKLVKVPITKSVEWNMYDHIQRCTNVANGWFNSGKNDGMRPYRDIVTPILNVARRSEGFDVKDIEPYVNSVENWYKSFLVRKYHTYWARENKLDNLIDEVVDSSIIYDLVLLKNVNENKPEVVNLLELAFCDQTDVLSGPICIKHQYSIADLKSFQSVWGKDKVDRLILNAKNSRENKNKTETKTAGQYITLYELHGIFPQTWRLENGDENEYELQMHLVSFISGDNGDEGFIIKSGKLDKSIFKAMVINPVFGRACGKGLVESLFEPQVWVNYNEIKIKELLDAAALVLYQTSSKEVQNQNLSGLKNNTLIRVEDGKPITQVANNASNIVSVANNQTKHEQDARVIGSANEAQLGVSPTSGTPLGLQEMVVQQGQGIHEWKRGRIASFFADELYKDWILPALVEEMNEGKSFVDELTTDELEFIANKVADYTYNEREKELLLSGQVITEEIKNTLKGIAKDTFKAKGSKHFLEILKDELKEIPIDVFININGKQRNMIKNTQVLTNITRDLMANIEKIRQFPEIAKLYNQLVEESGFSAVDFDKILSTSQQIEAQMQPAPAPQTAEVSQTTT